MAYLTQILRPPNSSFSRTLASKFYPTIINQDWFACSIFNSAILSSTCSFRAFGSFAAESGPLMRTSLRNLLWGGSTSRAVWLDHIREFARPVEQVGSTRPPVEQSLEDGMVDHQEFQNWSNGGGLCHNLACMDPTAVVEIGAVIHERATLGANVHVGSGSVVGPCVRVGHSTSLGYNVALSNCFIGDSCVFHNGVCIGQDGFGFFVDEHGNMAKKPQALYVRIGNHVEIGANTCVDRGSWRDTTVGDYTKIDNLVQIGHNVIIGKSCILCGQVGIAGSATVGDYVTFGGRVAVCDHVSIVSKVRLAANSCVTKDIKEPGDYGGFPAVPVQQWRRQIAALRLNSMKDIKNP